MLRVLLISYTRSAVHATLSFIGLAIRSGSAFLSPLCRNQTPYPQIIRVLGCGQVGIAADIADRCGQPTPKNRGNTGVFAVRTSGACGQTRTGCAPGLSALRTATQYEH